MRFDEFSQREREYLSRTWMEKGKWVLQRPSNGTLLPVNTEERTCLLIEDPEETKHVVKKMLEAGVPVLDDLQWSKKTPES